MKTTTISVMFFLAPFKVLAEDEEIINSAIPYSPISVGNVMQVLTGLLAVVVLIFILYALFKRFGNYTGKMGGAIKVVAGLSIGPKEKIILLEAGGEQILIGVAPGVIRKLHKMEKNIVELHGEEKKENGFLDKYKKEIAKRCG